MRDSTCTERSKIRFPFLSGQVSKKPVSLETSFEHRPRRPTIFPRGVQDGPRVPQDRPATAQETLKRRPKRPKRAPRRPTGSQEGTRGPQEGPKRVSPNQKSEHPAHRRP
eukprot:1812291-Pyramimonas_sp.AAC.1